MNDTLEENFPRGGMIKGGSRTGRKRVNKEDDLFKIVSNDIPRPKKAKKRGNKTKVQERVAGAELENSSVVAIEKVPSILIVEDLLILGRVQEVQDFKLVIALPENITGEVAITDICSAYTNALQSLADEDSDNCDVHSLGDLFSIGQLVCCRVKSVKKKDRKTEIHLTLDPKSINRDIDYTKLTQNTILNGNIKSHEDHGYTVDIGLPGLTAFIQNAEALKHNDGKSLPVGMPVHCSLTKQWLESIKSKMNRVITVRLKQAGSVSIETAKDAVMANLLPGTVVNAEVVAIQSNGITVNYLGKFKGAIHRHHLNTDLSKFKKDEQIKACVLFHLPLAGVSYLSTLHHLTEGNSKKSMHYEMVQAGDIFESANLLNVEPYTGALLKLKNDILAYLPLRYVDDNPQKRNFINFPKNGIKCRVIDFDMMNNVAIVSCCKSFLDRSIVKISDCKPGQIVDGKIQRFIKGHIIVLIAGFYRGFIPEMHNANVPLKQPERKYKVDDTIKCRILKFDKSHTRHAVSLTAKEALVKSKLPILSSMDILEKDMIVEGFIVRINPSGLVVAFYNDVRGFVHKSEAGVNLSVISENFYVGQVVKCRVISWDIEKGKIGLSMKLDGQENVGVKEMRMQAALDARATLSCQVVKISEKGLSVRLGQVAGFIPVYHLSDNFVNCKHLWKLYKPRQFLERVVLFERGATPIFSLKQSLLKAIGEGGLVDNFDDLLPGTTVPGVVRNMVDFGLFVQLSHNLRGVAANRFITDQYVENVAGLYRTGQSVIVHVRETDPERNRIWCSLRMSDCYHGDTSLSVALLTSYLSERRRILEYYEKYGQDASKTLTTFQVGSTIDVEIEKVNDFGAIGHEVSTQVKVVCTAYHMEGCSVKVGEHRRAIVLYQDLEANCLEVTMSKKHVKAISHRVDGPNNHANEGTVTDAVVLLVKPDFVLVALRGRAEYKIAYAPAQRCFNDVNGSSFFEPGFSDKVEIKNTKNDLVVCSWQAYEETMTKKLVTPKKIEAHKLEIGLKVRAVIREVLPFQLNVRIGGIPGRIFASEIETEDFLIGDRLVGKFHPGDVVEAVVIGFRNTKSLKLTEHIGDRARGMPECSILKRRLEGDLSEPAFACGQKIPGFFYLIQKQVVRFRLSPTMNGQCKLVHADLTTDELEKPDQLQAGAYYPLTVVAKHEKSCEVSMIEEDCMTVGQTLICSVLRFRKDALLLKLPWSQRGIVALTEMGDEYVENFRKAFVEGQYVRGQIIGKDDEHGFAVSLRESRFTPMLIVKKPKDKLIESRHDLVENEIVRGFVHRCVHNGVTVLLGNGIYGVANRGQLPDNAAHRMKKLYPKNKLVTVKIVKLDKDIIQVSLKKIDTGALESTKVETGRKRRNSDRVSECGSEEFSKKRKLSETESESSRKRTESGSDFESPALGTRQRRLSEISDTKSGEENEEENDEEMLLEKLPILDLDRITDSSSAEESDSKPTPKLKLERKPKSKKSKKPEAAKKIEMTKTDDSEVHHLKVSEGFAWVTDFQLPTTKKYDSESSDDEVKQPVAKQDKKLEEKRLIELENRMLDTSRIPETEDEFDRLVVQSPDSSMIWMQYMAHHLKMAEIDKARSIAERALKTISFREEQEKMNVWAALMNLENTYGTPEQLKNVFDRAVQANDPFKMHNQLVNIYVNSEKSEQAERLYSTIVRQFGSKKQVWIEFATFYFKQNRYDSARKILERSLKTLDKRDHMEVVSKFGRLEFEHGQNEQAIQLFERVLTECPKRLDVWNVYVDMLVKFSTVEKVRRVFLKLTEIPFPAKKMKSVYKKWLDFEAKHGDEDSVAEVKNRATKYAEANLGN